MKEEKEEEINEEEEEGEADEEKEEEEEEEEKKTMNRIESAIVYFYCHSKFDARHSHLSNI